ncbi:hypothetical protein BH09ACT10_BH09ACT10_11260 [soil metagenome]
MTTTPSPSVESPKAPAPQFPPPTASQILRGLRAPAIGYAWLLLGAVVMMGLIVVAANVGSTGEQTGVDSDDTNAIGVLIGMPFQIAGMALLGSLHFTEEGIRASIFLPPLILTALFLVMTTRAAKRSEAIPAAGTRVLLGVIVGLAAAAVLTPATWALAMRSDGTSLHTASVNLFFGVWVLTGVSSYLGTSRTAGSTRPSWIPSEYVVAARIWAGSLAVWVVVAFVVLTVVASIKLDLWVGILSPLWGVNGGLYSYAVGHLGGLSFGGETTTIVDFSAVWIIAMVVGALALATLTSIAWHLRRDDRESTLSEQGSWIVLPATYAAGGVLVWLVPRVILGGGFGGIGGSVAFHPAFWLALVLLAWGAAVEVASRYVAPSLAPALPSRLHAALRGPEASGSPLPVEVPAILNEATPLTAAERARYKKIGLVAGGLVVIGIIGWIAVSVVNSQFYGPKDQAASYLDAVVDGDLETAVDLAPIDSDQANDSLLTSGVYRAAKNRITGYEISEIDKDGDTVSIQVQLQGLGGPENTELTLEKGGHTAMFFNKWRLTEGGLAKTVSVSFPDGASKLTVNGVAADLGDADVWLLPGAYDFDAFDGNPWLEGSGEPITISADENYQYAEVSPAVASSAFNTEVQRQIDSYLAECIASTELDPDNCPNSTYAFGDVRNVKWTLTQAPTADFSTFDGTFPADLSYGESGQATVTYEGDESYGFGPRDWQEQTEEIDLHLSSVTVTESGDSLLVTISE